MGTCFGHFRKRHKTKRHVRLHRCFYFHNPDRVEFELLVDAETTSSAEFLADAADVWCTSNRSSNCLSKQQQRPVLKRWLDETGSNALEGESTQLVPLDAHSLLAARALQTRKISWSSSTPPSSIDLEWENEVGVSSTTVPRLKSQRSSSSNVEESSSGGGAGASPESLEWDPGTDGETEQLISEIEQLTARALRETGAWSAAAAPF